MKTQRSHRYCVVDVFTDQPFEGNSLAVFPDASGLDDDTMQELQGSSICPKPFS